jgi:hypothetical protein
VRSRRAQATSLAASRLAAAAGAGSLVLVALEALGPPPPLSPLVAAAVAAAVTGLLPRLGWIAAALGVCGWLASPEAGREGTALVLAAGLAPVPLLLPRAGHLWSLPAVAPLLGTAALAPAFVGVASLASNAWRRAGLAAAGCLWVAVAEVVTGETLLFGIPDGAAPRGDWEGSLGRAATDALAPLVMSPALAPLAVGALFAVLLPAAVRGRFLALDLAAGLAWAAGLVAALAAVGDLLAATTAIDHARGAVAGALLGALAVVVAAAAAREPEAPPGEPAPAA